LTTGLTVLAALTQVFGSSYRYITYFSSLLQLFSLFDT